MATTLEALLKLKATASGIDAIAGMEHAMTGVSVAAGEAKSAFVGLADAGGGLGNAFAALTPALTIAGIGAMAKGAIETADSLNDLSQQTGVSVEGLSVFSKAAKLGGTDLETVSGAMGKLAKNMYEASNGNQAIADKFKNMGIAIADSKGKLYSVDQVMLQVATRFQGMEDGAKKQGEAFDLMGRKGAELIPMLNEGGDAIARMGTKMTTAFAQQADAYNDKLTILTGKVGALGGRLAVALLPTLTKLTDSLSLLLDKFNSLDPKVQSYITWGLALAIAWKPVVGIISFLGEALGVVLGVLGALGGSFAVISGWLGAVAPVLATIGEVLGALGAVALEVFTGPVGWVVLIASVVAALYAFRKTFVDIFTAIWQFDMLVLNGLKSGWDTFTGWIQTAFNAIGKFFQTYVATPLVNAWNGAIDLAKRALRGLLSFGAAIINQVIGSVNSMLNGINNALAKARLPLIPLIAQVQVPAFASGGYVTGPTIGMVGDAGPEYIIPASRMGNASAAYLSGARGSAVLAGAKSADAPVVNITTGPVMQANGESWVTLTDLERATRQTAEAVLATLRTPAGRRAIGVA